MNKQKRYHKRIRVLHISESDYIGGASIAQYRLHKGLIESGVDSKMLVLNKITKDQSVIAVKECFRKRIRKYNLWINKVISKATGFKKKHWVKYPGFGIGVIDKKYFHNIDVIYLGWIERGILSISDIKKLPCPAIWTPHLLWPITEGSQYYYQNLDDNYKMESVPIPGTNFELFLRKYRKKSWGKRKDWVVCQSKWMEKLTKTSPFFENKRVQNIGFYMNLDYWKPGNRLKARKLFEFDDKDFIVCLGATNIRRNVAKGYEIACEVIQRIISEHDNNIRFAVYGSGNIEGFDESKVIPLGKISHEKLRLLFHASDCCLNTSKIETFCIVVQESMACGTPVVAFPVGGIPEMIVHQRNGYLAKPFDSTDLVCGIKWIYENKTKIEKIRDNARDRIVQLYGKANTIDKHLKLLNEIIALNEY